MTYQLENLPLPPATANCRFPLPLKNCHKKNQNYGQPIVVLSSTYGRTIMVVR